MRGAPYVAAESLLKQHQNRVFYIPIDVRGDFVSKKNSHFLSDDPMFDPKYNTQHKLHSKSFYLQFNMFRGAGRSFAGGWPSGNLRRVVVFRLLTP